MGVREMLRNVFRPRLADLTDDTDSSAESTAVDQQAREERTRWAEFQGRTLIRRARELGVDEGLRRIAGQ